MCLGHGSERHARKRILDWIGEDSHFGALLCIFEDSEAVIKMILKGTSPTMRHSSRTHRVAHGLLVDRINLDTKIQNKCVDTKNQLADMLTTGNFTRDEWNHLHRLINIMSISMFCCSHFSPNDNPQLMSKRLMQRQNVRLRNQNQ